MIPRVQSLLFTVILITFLGGSLYAQSRYEDGEYYSEESGIANNPYKKFAGFVLEASSGYYIYTDSELQTDFFTFGFYPRYNFIAPNKNFSLSIGSPLGLGFNFFSNASGNFYGFMLQSPVTLDLNLGSNATKDNTALAGLFLGLGLNYNLSAFGQGNQNFTFHTFGPIFHGGIKWIRYGSPQGIRLSFSQNFKLPPKDIGNGITQVNPVNSRSIISFSYTIGL